MKEKVLSGIDTLMVFILSLFGFGCFSCGMYAVPYATLEVSGTVTNKENERLEDMRVTVKHQMESGEQQIFPRTYTNQIGEYYEKDEGAFPVKTLDIVVEDPSGVYERDSVRVEVEYDRRGVTSSWNHGQAHVIQDFQLEKK